MAIRLQYINVSNKHVVHLKLTQCYFPGGSDSKASCLQCGRPGFDPLEKEMATHSSTLAWKIPWTEKHGGLQSMGLQRAGHD